MTDDCFIGIDQGSSATKALVMTADGRMAHQTRRSLPHPLREGLRVEQDPMAIIASVKDALDEAAISARASGLTIKGIGLSCQRSSCLIWNEATLIPLSPVLSWRDTRGLEYVRNMPEKAPFIFETTGLPLTPYYSASKFRWLKENIPAARDKTTVFGTLSSFLIHHLTGGSRAKIDHANAARTQLMGIRSLAWDDELLRIFGLEDIRLPEIMPTCHAFGAAETPAGAVPLLACTGDQQAAAIGLGVIEKGDGGINYGTGGFLMACTGREFLPAKRLMSSILYSTESGKNCLLEGSVNAVGDGLEWLRARLGLFKDYTEVDDLCWKANTDVAVFLGLNGTGAPHWEADISSAVHGLAAESTGADIVRGVVEGAAFFMKDIDDEIRAYGIEPSSYAVSGGLSSLTYLVQIQADILKNNLRLSAEQEVSALGAALLAGMQSGAWTDADIKKMTAQGETVSGEPNPGLERRYRRWKELHRMTKALDDI